MECKSMRKKTVLIAINNSDKEATLSFGTPAEEIKPLGRNEDTQILGVFVSASGSPTSTTQRVTTATETMCNILRRKAITDRQAAYIINSVLLPQILYRSTLTVLPTSTVNTITGKYTKLCKSKSQMPTTTPNSLMHHRNMYGIKKLGDVQCEEQISTLQLRLNDPGLVGETTRARLFQLQVRNAMAEVPTRSPAEVKPYRQCLLSQVCQLMHDRGVTLDINMAPAMDLPTNALSILKWSNGALERDVLFELSKRGIFYLEQILENESHLMSPYTSEYLRQWMEQKREDLEHISDEDLDPFINDQHTPTTPSSNSALPSESEAEDMVEELVENGDLEEEEDNGAQTNNAPQAASTPPPMRPHNKGKYANNTTFNNAYNLAVATANW
ncbi:hypothetical protein MVEG_03316 [Podila verticillata NRRL 6337]|nr:hypothetical protein MVEG_03316 [Podila verticillata NRRL 6337]